jgi:hypothetical protein
MGALLAASSAYLPVPPSAALEIPDYPQFERVPVPDGSDAICAWIGTIQPFGDDAAGRAFLRRIEAKLPFDVVEGTIIAHPLSNTRHWADPWLVGMGMRFRLLVLEFNGSKHPRAYALQPEISRSSHPLHPHLRTDLVITVGRRELPALCVYSGAAFSYSPGWPRIVQFLDQTATYIGRHIIWLRTRVEIPARFGGTFHVPSPGEPIFDHRPRFETDPIASVRSRGYAMWSGYWAGPVAPSGASEHLQTIRPSHECWCCSGKKYGECHRPIDREITRLALAS